jgi:hypothetical protein
MAIAKAAGLSLHVPKYEELIGAATGLLGSVSVALFDVRPLKQKGRM